MFKSVLFLMMQTWEQPMFPSIERWINKMWHGHMKQLNQKIYGTDLQNTGWSGTGKLKKNIFRMMASI